MTEIRVFGYSVSIASGSIDDIGATARQAAPAHRYAIVTDEQVGAHYAGRVERSFGGERPVVVTIPAGESEKTRHRWAEVTDRLIDAGLGRDSAIIALGGGVVGDLAGFVAATFMRGIPFVQVPTSLVAMIDASVGGKTGVDTPAGKNLVGAFHQPAAVIVDPDTLATLPVAHRRAGLAEAIKHGVIADAKYFAAIEGGLPGLVDSSLMSPMHDLIRRSIEIKASVVQRDERESGPRKILNFGHTLGHAVEQLSGYSLLHGEAVAIGMVLEARLGERAGVTEAGTAARIEACLRAAGLPTDRPSGMKAADLVAATRGDQKARRGRVEYALPARVGEMAGASTNYGIPLDDPMVESILN